MFMSGQLPSPGMAGKTEGEDRATNARVRIRPMLPDDIPLAQAIGKATWSRVASDDLGRQVEYPTRPGGIIQAAIEEEPRGCFIAMLGDEPVGTAYSHVWGSVGWVGPVEVLPDHQGLGVGKTLMEACHAHLDSRGCRVFGVETMSDNEGNKRFYAGLGYRPVGVTVFAEKKLRPAGYFISGIRELNASNLEENSGEIRKLSSAVFPGMDCNSEFRGALNHSLGKAFLFRHDGITKGAALLMEAPLEGLHMVSIRLVLTDPTLSDRGAVMSSLMAACEQSAISSGNDRVFTSCSITSDISHILVERDYKISASNVRFVRGDDYSEAGGTNIIAWAG
jgi:GNAT superfamily N-acetyltransferase